MTNLVEQLQEENEKIYAEMRRKLFKLVASSDVEFSHGVFNGVASLNRDLETEEAMILLHVMSGINVKESIDALGLNVISYVAHRTMLVRKAESYLGFFKEDPTMFNAPGTGAVMQSFIEDSIAEVIKMVIPKEGCLLLKETASQLSSSTILS